MPRAMQNAKRMEFENLKQRGLTTVADYQTDFTNLAVYAPYLVANDEMKARKFEEGLKHEIRKIVSPFQLPTYTEVLDRAILEESRKFNERKRNLGKGSQNFAKKPRYNNQGNNQRNNQRVRNDQRRPACHTCGRIHGGECWAQGPTVCYGCGQTSHYKNACPNVATGANAVPRINA